MSKRRGGNAPAHNDPNYDATEHRLVLVNRNHADGIASHRHPWQASCVCGWRAVATRRAVEAEDRYRQHRNKMTSITRQNARTTFEVQPRQPTPTAQLPEALR